LRELDADIVFLQEVQGEHTRHAERFHNYPGCAQHEFIAEEVWLHSVYGKNSVYEAGHHGNAILNRFPILQSLNMDVSAHRFENAGCCIARSILTGGRALPVRAFRAVCQRSQDAEARPDRICAQQHSGWRATDHRGRFQRLAQQTEPENVRRAGHA
jgi:endonuclease/exonuclease/phosphatase family metal-dependent hydrolase